MKNFLGQNHKDERQPLKGKEEKPICQPLGEIRVIIGGMLTRSLSKAKKIYLRVVQSVQLIGRPHRMTKEDEPTITFTDEDARQLHHPHNDAIVIAMTIANYTTRRVLIDNGSSANILYYPVFQQMRINKELLHPMNVPLIGFIGMKVLLVDTISLPVIVGFYRGKSIRK